MQAVLHTNGPTRELADLDSDEYRNLQAEVYQALRAASDHMHEGDGIPAFAPPTCGDRYVMAERALRILEACAPRSSIDTDMIETINQLCDEAGPAFARIALRDAMHMDQMEPPF